MAQQNRNQKCRGCKGGGIYQNLLPIPSFLLGKNRSSENTVREEWVISFCLGGYDKNLGEGFAWGHE